MRKLDTKTKVIAIYSITNILTSKIYIGSTNNLYQRIIDHKSHLKYNKHCNRFIQSDYNFFGIKVFKFDILEELIDSIKLIEREQFYIDLIKPEYNIHKNAGTPLGMKYSEESKKKMSQSQIGNKNAIAKKVIDTSTGRTWTCVRYAAEELCINYSTLIGKLNGHKKNNTSLKYIY